MLMLLAQAAAQDSTTGWVGLAVQAGALGLLTVIVVYLYPRGVKDAKEEREARDIRFVAALALIQEKVDVRIQSSENKFDARTTSIVAAIKEQTEKLLENMDKQAEKVSKELNEHSVRIERSVATACKAYQQHIGSSQRAS